MVDTFLEDRRAVDLDDAGIVLVLFVLGHGGVQLLLSERHMLVVG